MSDQIRWHIKDEISSTDKNQVSYCGKRIGMEFHFVSVGHIVAERHRRGRLLPCKECRDIVIKLLNDES